MIDPEKIRDRLEEVWIALGQTADAQNHEVMRACALTFIAITDEDDDPESVAQTLAELRREHPSRTIIVRLTPGSSDLLEADVDARCWMPFGTRQQICSEQIVIRCSEATLADVPGVILPLVAADLPVVLWCASARAGRSKVLADLAAPAGRVIMDSFLGGPALPGKLLADLSWTRLTRWRALIAQVFENELYRRQLPHFSAIHVHYEASDGPAAPPAALLMAGWLVSRLRWPQDRVRDQLHLHSRRATLCPGRLAALEMISHTDPATRVAILRTGPSCIEVRVEVAGLDTVMNRVSLPPSNDVQLLGEELAIAAPDPIFDESLKWARQIASMLS